MRERSRPARKSHWLWPPSISQAEPGPGVSPVAVAVAGDMPRPARPRRASGRRKTQLDQSALSGSASSQLAEGVVQGEQVVRSLSAGRRSSTIQVDAAVSAAALEALSCRGRDRPGCGASLRRRRRRSGRGRQDAGSPRPAAGTPRGRGRWPGASARASRRHAARRRASAVRRRRAGATVRGAAITAGGGFEQLGQIWHLGRFRLRRHMPKHRTHGPKLDEVGPCKSRM